MKRGKTNAHLVLGIDPGLQATGYGVVHLSNGRPRLLEGGVLCLSRALPLPQRLAELSEGIGQLLRQYHPEVVTVEELHARYPFVRTALLLAHARGVICAAAVEAGAEVIGYTATQVKKILTGNGRASKAQVGAMVARLLRLKRLPESDDVCDALALALCHLQAQIPNPRMGGRQ